MSQLVDPLGNVTQFTDNASGDPTSVTFADGTQTTSQYNAAGEVTSSTARDGSATTYAHNAQGQVTSETFADGSQVTYTYGTNQLVSSMTDSTGTTTYTYNADNQLVSVTDPTSDVLNYSYNGAGQLAEMSDSTGYTVQYVYNSLGQLSELKDGSGNMLVQYSYNSAGELTSTTMSNGTSTTYGYDADGNQTSVKNLGLGGTVLSSFTYTYNSRGQRASMTTAAGTTQYAYDLNGELTSVKLPSGELLSYEYDADGNLVAVTDSTGGTTDYAVNDLNEYTSAGTTTFTYNANGDLVSSAGGSGTTSYTYNDEGELVAVTSPSGSWTYQYNGLGQLVGEDDNGTQVSFEIDPLSGAIVGEFSSSGGVVAHFVQGLGLAEQIEASGAVDAYAFDGTSNTVALTGPTGSVLDQYSYTPWGQVSTVQQSVTNPFTFVGQLGVVSSGSGLSIMGQRAYDSTIGRFLQPDPTGYLGGSTNLYQYAANDPLNQVDPAGTDPVPLNGGEILNEQFVQNMVNALRTAIAPTSSTATASTASASTATASTAAATTTAEGTYTANTVQESLGTFGNLTVSDEGSVFLTPVGGGTIVALAGPTVIAGIGTAVALKDQLNQLQALPRIPGVSDSWSPLDNAINDHSLTFPGPSSNDLTLPLGNSKDIPPNTITFQNGVNNPQYKKLANDLFNDPDIGPEIWHDIVANNKTPDQAIQDVLANVPKAQQIAIQDVLSHDPNDIEGPQGVGSQGYVAAGQPLPYLIEFTNEASASAPAQTVTVTVHAPTSTGPPSSWARSASARRSSRFPRASTRIAPNST